jgi:dihydroorotase
MWTVAPAALATLGKNTPLIGRELRGRVVHAVVSGEVRYEAGVVAGA